MKNTKRNMMMMLSSTALAVFALAGMITTNAFAAISGDTDKITIIDNSDYDSDCSPNGIEEQFFIAYEFTGMPTPNSGWYLIYLESSDGVETLIERAWSPGVMEDGSGGGGYGTSLDVGQEPYTFTVYEGTGPDPTSTEPYNPETDIIIKPDGWFASVTFSCADLEPQVEEPPEEPETPLTERFKNQGQCVAYSNANPDDEDVTKELCKEAFTDNRRSNRV